MIFSTNKYVFIFKIIDFCFYLVEELTKVGIRSALLPPEEEKK